LPRKATLLLAAACLLVAIALRVPAAPRYLYYEDSINFAQAVERYDPRHLVPQPPGYPIFVLQAKLLRALAGSVENAFLLGVIFATAIALFSLAMLARTASGEWTPAIALTAFGNPQDRERALAAGFNLHVPKPIDPLALTTLIAGLVGRSRPS